MQFHGHHLYFIKDFQMLLAVKGGERVGEGMLPFGVGVSVAFHFMSVHYTFSSVWVAEWSPFGK